MRCPARCRAAWACCRPRLRAKTFWQLPAPNPGNDSMNVLVTGGTGFLGAYLVAALESAGHAAFAYDVAPPTQEMLAVSPALARRFRPGQIGDLARLFDVCRAE